MYGRLSSAEWRTSANVFNALDASTPFMLRKYR
jgi:hypothetical protein